MFTIADIYFYIGDYVDCFNKTVPASRYSALKQVRAMSVIVGGRKKNTAVPR